MRTRAHTCTAADAQISSCARTTTKIRNVRNIEAKNFDLEISYDRTVEGGTHICLMGSSQFLSPKGWRTSTTIFSKDSK